MNRMVTFAFTAVSLGHTLWLIRGNTVILDEQFLILGKFEKTQRRIGGGLRLYFQCQNGWLLPKTTKLWINVRFERNLVRFYESVVKGKLRSPRLFTRESSITWKSEKSMSRVTYWTWKGQPYEGAENDIYPILGKQISLVSFVTLELVNVARSRAKTKNWPLVLTSYYKRFNLLIDPSCTSRREWLQHLFKRS